MIKHFCDICGKELLQGQFRVKYKVRKLKREKQYDDLRWVEIEAHDKCIDRILEVVFCEKDDNPLKKVKTAEPLTVNKWSGAGW